MKNSIKNLTVKFIAIIFAAGLMAGCGSSLVSSGMEQQPQPQKVTANSDSLGIHHFKAGDDEMDPIITPAPTMQGR